MFAIVLVFGIIFLLGSQIKVRKAGFYGAVVSLLLFVVVTSFAISARRDILDRSAAIVMSSAISVKSSPDRAATDIFVLHEGTKVTISTEVDGWCEVTIADGKKGWTESSHLERI
jgi:SH3-like domain-containing protein